MIKVENEVTIYEVDGNDTPMADPPTLRVLSHWNENARVTLEIDGRRLTVTAKDLRTAIDNAMNIARF